jgi:hypothetical protein
VVAPISAEAVFCIRVTVPRLSRNSALNSHAPRQRTSATPWIGSRQSQYRVESAMFKNDLIAQNGKAKFRASRVSVQRPAADGWVLHIVS